MSETPTQLFDQEQQPKDPNFDPSEGNPFVDTKTDVDEFDQAVAIAKQGFERDTQPQVNGVTSPQRVETRQTQTPSERQPKSFATNAIKTLAGVSVVAAGAGYLAGEALSGPEISDETQTVVVEDGDTLYKIVNDHVEGAENVDIGEVIDHIKKDPENAQVLVDPATGKITSDIHPGESIEVPKSVSD